MKSNYRKGTDAEKLVAKQEGGRTQPGSGSQWHSKGDVKTDDKLIQVKYTEKRSYTLKLEDLEHIERQALANNKNPEFVLIFKLPTGKIRQYRIIREWV